MQVFQFQKSFQERIDECLSVLSWKEVNIPASKVKSEWSYFIELQIEPSGWQALWKIPRNVCEKFKIRYPSIVFGLVEHVNFQDLNAIYNIKAVQDEKVHLPERHEVALEDLWPTIMQENVELNIERTADCIDRLRFFYTHVWMPWDIDNDDDFNWVEKHLQSRINLCFDLRQHNISRPIASFIRSLISEAKYIEQKREYIEEDILDEQLDDCDKKALAKPRLTQLMLMHLRMTMIRSHIEMLENPDMRPIYEDVKFSISKNAVFTSVRNEEKYVDPVSFIVILPSTLSKQVEMLESAKRIISQNSDVLFNHSLQNVLDMYKPGDKTFLSAGCHVLHYPEYFFTGGQLSGIEFKKNDSENCVRIYCSANSNSLFIIDGNFTLENIELKCENILAGIVVKHGTLTMRNCKLVGNGKSSIQQGIVCNTYAAIHMENCYVENFATGIILCVNSSLTLTNSFVTNCSIGMEMSEASNIKCYKSSFNNCIIHGIYLYSLSLKDEDNNFITLKNFKDLEKYSNENLHVSGDCCFNNCNNNITIFNDNNSLVSRKTFNFIENIL